MALYWQFVAQSVIPYALFYALWWRFVVRRSPAPWWVHAIALVLLWLQGAVWLYAANLGGAPRPGGPGWFLATLALPAAFSWAAAWFVRVGTQLLARGEGAGHSRPTAAALVTTILGSAVWGLALLFTAVVIGVALASVRPPAPSKPTSVVDPFASPRAPAPLPPGYSIESPSPPTTPSTPAAGASVEEAWSHEALAWESRNPRFLADPVRAQAMQQAIDEVERNSGGQLGARDLLMRAEALAFQRTGWREQLQRHERACGDAFTIKLRALDGLPLGEFGRRHEQIVAEKDRCLQAAR